jgi:hypothetical protein
MITIRVGKLSKCYEYGLTSDNICYPERLKCFAYCDYADDILKMKISGKSGLCRQMFAQDFSFKIHLFPQNVLQKFSTVYF